MAPLELRKVQLLPEAQRPCVAVSVNALAPPEDVIVTLVVWLYPVGVALVKAPALYVKAFAK
jgi:hypothetical protein